MLKTVREYLSIYRESGIVIQISLGWAREDAGIAPQEACKALQTQLPKKSSRMATARLVSGWTKSVRAYDHISGPMTERGAGNRTHVEGMGQVQILP